MYYCARITLHHFTTRYHHLRTPTTSDWAPNGVFGLRTIDKATGGFFLLKVYVETGGWGRGRG